MIDSLIGRKQILMVAYFCLQVSGTVVISEFCLGVDAEDYLFQATCDGSDDKHDCLLKGLRSVKSDIYEVLQRFDEEIKGLSE